MFLESIDLYAKNWSKREQVELKYLFEWKDQLKELVADCISSLKGHFKSPKCKVLDQPDVKGTLHKLHANYVLVPADKAANNVQWDWKYLKKIKICHTLTGHPSCINHHINIGL